jgi:valyl-tRNA synthetase
MPYVTEELWDRLPMTDGLVFAQPYPPADGRFDDGGAAADMDLFQGLVAAARNIRAQYNVDPGARIRLLVKTPAGGEAVIERFRNGIEQLVKTESIECGPFIGKEKGSASTPVAGYEVIIPLGGLADVDAEKTRLGKEMDKIEAAYAATTRKLSNEDFLNKAKEEVVLKEREKQTLLHAELEKIRESLRILGEM